MIGSAVTPTSSIWRTSALIAEAARMADQCRRRRRASRRGSRACRRAAVPNSITMLARPSRARAQRVRSRGGSIVGAALGARSTASIRRCGLLAGADDLGAAARRRSAARSRRRRCRSRSTPRDVDRVRHRRRSSRSFAVEHADGGHQQRPGQHQRVRPVPCFFDGVFRPFAHCGTAMRAKSARGKRRRRSCRMRACAYSRRWQRRAPIMTQRARQDLRSRRDRGEVVRALGRERPVPPRAPRRRALHHRQPAAQRHRQPAYRPCARQHAAGHRDPLRAAARQGRAVGGRHRPCRHRHADGGRAPAGSSSRTSAPITRARTSSTRSGNGRTKAAARSPASCAGWAVRWTGAASSSPWTRTSPARW